MTHITDIRCDLQLEISGRPLKSPLAEGGILGGGHIAAAHYKSHTLLIVLRYVMWYKKLTAT